MAKDTIKTAAVAADLLLFDDWSDAIEDGVRAHVRGFIEAMLEEELAVVPARPRYGPMADARRWRTATLSRPIPGADMVIASGR